VRTTDQRTRLRNDGMCDASGRLPLCISSHKNGCYISHLTINVALVIREQHPRNAHAVVGATALA
jgi:hypothetical protein